LAYVLGTVENFENQPTMQSYMVYEDLAPKVNAQLRALSGILSKDVAAFNKAAHDTNESAVLVPTAR
jgi:hypothetical protein